MVLVKMVPIKELVIVTVIVIIVFESLKHLLANASR